MAADGAPQTRDVGPLRLRKIMNAGAVLRLQHHRKLGQDQGARVCRQLFKLDDCTGHIGPQWPGRLGSSKYDRSYCGRESAIVGVATPEYC